MELPQDALDDFRDLKQSLRRHGTEIDRGLREVADDDQMSRLKTAYENGKEEKARDLLRLLVRSLLHREVTEAKRHLKDLKEEISRREEALSAMDQQREAESKLDYVLGRNVQTLRRLFGLSKTALAERTGSITRQTLLKIERGQGLRLNVVESIAEALHAPSESLLLDRQKIGVLYWLTRPTDPMQNLLGGLVSDPNEGALYARSLASEDRLDREALMVVGDALEFVDAKYDNPAARAGAAIGWLWGLPPHRRPELEDDVDRDLVAAAVGGWWIHSLSAHSDLQ